MERKKKHWLQPYGVLPEFGYRVGNCVMWLVTRVKKRVQKKKSLSLTFSEIIWYPNSKQKKLSPLDPHFSYRRLSYKTGIPFVIRIPFSADYTALKLFSFKNSYFLYTFVLLFPISETHLNAFLLQRNSRNEKGLTLQALCKFLRNWQKYCLRKIPPRKCLGKSKMTS